MPDVLEKILEARRESVSLAKQKRSLLDLESTIKFRGPRPSMLEALDQAGQISLIAEMKKQSPSAGLIRESYDVLELAKAYEQGGACALSVLTEDRYFGGSIDDLDRVSRQTRLPILRKDFIFDEYQIIEAKAYGASAVLFIADMLEDSRLQDLMACAQDVGMETLVEVFSQESMPRAIKTGSRLLGVNTRNLRTLTMHPDNIYRLAQLMPPDAILVAESGIKTSADVQKLKQMPVAAMLVGESLLKQKDCEAATRLLVEAARL